MFKSEYFRNKFHKTSQRSVKESEQSLITQCCLINPVIPG